MGYGARKPGFKQATQKKFVKRVGQTRPNDANGAWICRYQAPCLENLALEIRESKRKTDDPAI